LLTYLDSECAYFKSYDSEAKNFDRNSFKNFSKPKPEYTRRTSSNNNYDNGYIRLPYSRCHRLSNFSHSNS